ncbi:EF-hand domain-containing family member B isoform X1 [Hippocampus comes]|uniref:EF-hand domain-containing family member B isoform X1 n=1 Tax=Hippocampus comes TaxID=109280 RepID=UPI00094E6309|nr:PREDICTED: EF-hand domain-containing family member B isoform X1 [Hippocampus comes]
MTDAMRIADLPRAGKQVPIGDRAATCLQEIKRAATPPVVRKYRNSNRPGLGMVRVHHGKANDPKVAVTLVHGLCTKSSQTAAVMLNPQPVSKFQQKLQEFSEAVIASQKAALQGRSPNPAGLPTWYNEQTTFGIKTLRDVDAANLIYPPKTLEELEKEEQEAHKVYVRSHNGYFVGEQKDRKYNYDKGICFGIQTPFCKDGRQVSRSLHWLGESTRLYNPNPEWKRSPNSREKLEQQIGNVNKRGNNVEVPQDRTFGIIIPQDEYSVGELIHSAEQPADKRERAGERQRCLAMAVRNRLKVINLQNFPSLLQAFRHYDKKGKGRIDKEDLQEVCRHFQVVASEAVLDDVVNDCDLDRDGFINFLEFANFLNLKEKMPLDRREQHLVMNSQFQTGLDYDHKLRLSELPGCGALLTTNDLEPFKTGNSKRIVRTLRRPEALSDRFITTASFIGAAAEEPQPSHTRTFGVPSVRTDLVPPRNRKFNNNINYGDMVSVMDLLLPSVYGRQGVYQDHFFCPRSKSEIAEIFGNVGANLPEETFEEAWNLASMKHPDGEVCVESFRTVLEEINAL